MKNHNLLVLAIILAFFVTLADFTPVVADYTISAIDKHNVVVFYSSQNLWDFGWLSGLPAQRTLPWDRIKIIFEMK